MFKNDRIIFNDNKNNDLQPLIMNNNNQNPFIYILIVSSTLLVVLGVIYCIVYFI
jgi:hypothetical protein